MVLVWEMGKITVPSLGLPILIMFLRQVCPQVVVPEGQNALLTCVYTESDLPSQPSVRWIDPEDNVLLKLTEGRVEIIKPNVIFLENQKKGNFSIQIKKVSKEQRGIYECLIHKVDYLTKIYLNVTDKAEKSETLPQGSATVLHFSWPAFLMLCVSSYLF